MRVDLPLTDFSPVDDRIMGGVSQSHCEMDGAGSLRFYGCVSPQNGGGFCSIRTTGLALDLTRTTVFRCEVKGDGKVYLFRLFSERRFDGCAYETSVVSKAGEWVSHTCALSELLPKWRGRSVASAPALDLSCITSVGIMISGGQLGEFSVVVRCVGFE